MAAQPFTEQAVLDLLHKCTECGICQKACPFLEKYGLPKEIIQEKKEVVFYCTNCSACTYLCKEGLNPAEALFSLKRQLLKESSALGQELKKRALLFTKRIQSFPFVYWEKAERVFWPGCSFWGTYPQLISKILKILNKNSGNKIKLILDCCLDPLYQIGAIEEVKRGWENFNLRFFHYGIKEVILGCTNCFKIFKRYSKDLVITHIFEVLPEQLFENLPPDSFLHLPCPFFKERDLEERFFQKFSGKFAKVLKIPSCCGAGGGAYINEELSQGFLEKTLNKAQKNIIVTLCFGCKNRFIGKETKALHLLETLREIEPLEKRVSSKTKWLNRLKFSLDKKFFKAKTLLFFLFLSLIFLSFYFQWKGLLNPEILTNQLKKLAGHPMAFFAYLLAYSLAPSFFISSLALTILAGFLWGPIVGGILALTGATLGATLSFQLARYFFRDTLKVRLGYEKWKYFEEITKKHGWKAVAFVRLFPLFPFPVVNYLFGLTSIDLKIYVISTFVFMAPAGFVYTGLGYSLKGILFEGKILPLILALVFLGVLTLLLRYFSKRWKF